MSHFITGWMMAGLWPVLVAPIFILKSAFRMPFDS